MPELSDGFGQPVEPLFRPPLPRCTIHHVKAHKKKVLTVSILAGLVLASSGVALAPRLRELFYLSRLESGYAEQRVEAARRLAEIRSAEAVPGIVAAVSDLCVEDGVLRQTSAGEELFAALERIGRPATPGLLVCLEAALARPEHDGDGTLLVALIALHQIYPDHPGASGNSVLIKPLVEALRDDETQTLQVRDLASRVLEEL